MLSRDPQITAQPRSPRKPRRGLLAGSFAALALTLVGGQPAAHARVWSGVDAAAAAASDVSFDTGSGLTFVVNAKNGNLTSLKHRGVELAAPGQAAGQIESGWAAAAVSSRRFDNGSILVTVANNGIGVTQYYYARRGDNTIYMATNVSRPQNPGEDRFISRLKPSLLPTSVVAARTAGSVAAVEGSDVFRFANGQTASKFYSSQRLITQKPFGARGRDHGVYIVPGTQELGSGGPFFRDIEVNDTGTAVNLTQVMNSGHTQTEPLRFGLHGPYALAVTNGDAPAAHSLDFLSAYIPGLLSNAQRGRVSGTATGAWQGQPVTVGLSGPTGQYWGRVKIGRFLIDHIRPGTYTARLYAGELAVGTPKKITVTSGATATTSLSGSVPASGTLFQIGAFDGTPAGFLNADRIETMHPSDPRMSRWNIGTFDVAAGAAKFPMAEFKSVNSPLAVRFPLASVPARGVRLRIATTLNFAGGRPAVAIGGYTSPISASPVPVDLKSRGVTRGTWRGVNTTYTFTIPARALRAGSNTLSISVLSGSSSTTPFLNPNFVFDALALDPA